MSYLWLESRATHPPLGLNLLLTLLMILLMTLLTATMLVALLHLLIMTITRLRSARTLESSGTTLPALGIQLGACTRFETVAVFLLLLRTGETTLPTRVTFMTWLMELRQMGTWSQLACCTAVRILESAEALLTVATLMWGITILWVTALFRLTILRTTDPLRLDSLLVLAITHPSLLLEMPRCLLVDPTFTIPERLLVDPEAS